jgi:hypothetical protein
MRVSSLPLLIIVMPACGEGIVSGDFRGDPLLTVHGLVCGMETSLEPVAPKAGLLWKHPGERELAFTISAITPVAEPFPALFELPLFDPPPASSTERYETDRGDVIGGLGCPVVFDDLDRDGTFSAGDHFLAIAWNQLILYVGERSEVGRVGVQKLVGAERLKAGYQLVRGVCEDGERTELLERTGDLELVDVSLLNAPSDTPAAPPSDVRSCVSFF